MRKIIEMNLEVGTPIKINYSNGESAVGYYGGLGRGVSISLGHSLEENQEFPFNYYFGPAESIKRLYTKKEISSFDSLENKIKEGEIIELTIPRNYNNTKKGNILGYHRGIKFGGEIIICESNKGMAFCNQVSASFIPLIKSIKVLGEEA